MEFLERAEIITSVFVKYPELEINTNKPHPRKCLPEKIP